MKLAEIAQESFKQKRRLIAPLMGFPGVVLTGTNIKLAQQNYGLHYKVIKARKGKIRSKRHCTLFEAVMTCEVLIDLSDNIPHYFHQQFWLTD